MAKKSDYKFLTIIGETIVIRQIMKSISTRVVVPNINF